MGRAPCCDKNGLKKGPWTPEEDQKLIGYIEKNGHGSWRTLPKNAGLQRCGKSCRLRWANYLRPDIKRGRFSFEEEETIIQLHSVLGNKWSTIAARLPGRTDNEIKNYWNTHIRKRLLKMGIDPVTHTPRLDLLDLSSILMRSSLCNSSQLNISRLLGLQSLGINPELIRLMANTIQLQQEKPEYNLIQNLAENQLCNSQLQNQVPQSYQPNTTTTHQCPTQENNVPACTTTATPYVPLFTNDTTSAAQQVQGNVEPFQSNLTNFIGRQNSLTNLWRGNSMNFMESFTQLYGNQGFNMDDPFLLNCLSDIPSFQSNNGFNNPNFEYGSSAVSSTPSSSQTPLNSSTCVNSSTEDERDSYCSDMLKFEISDTLDINDFL